MKRFALGLLFALWSSVALAQGCGPSNPNCIVPTAPVGTNNNQAASTAFAQAAATGALGGVTITGPAAATFIPIATSPTTAAWTNFFGQNNTWNNGTTQTFDTILSQPSSLSLRQGLNVSQTGPTTGSQSGAFNFNQIFVNSNQYAVTGGGGNNEAALQIFYQFGGSNLQGGQNGILVSTNLSAASNVADNNPSYAAGNFLATASTNNNGTNTGAGAIGAVTGVDSFVNATAAATNWKSVTSAEFDTQCLAGCTTKGLFGVLMVRFGTGAAGATNDAAVAVTTATGATNWVNAFLLTDWSGAPPLGTGGCVICNDGNSHTIATFADLHTYTITGNIFNFVNFTVTGAGTLTAGNIVSTLSGTTNLAINNQGGVNNASLLFEAVGAPKWEIGKDGSNNFFLFDDVGAVNAMTITNNAGMALIPKNGHIAVSGGVNPTNNACTGFALTGSSKDTAGRVTFTSATSCAINFGTAYAAAPFCVVTPGTAATPSTVDVTTTTGVLTANFTTAQTSMSWVCFGA